MKPGPSVVAGLPSRLRLPRPDRLPLPETVISASAHRARYWWAISRIGGTNAVEPSMVSRPAAPAR